MATSTHRQDVVDLLIEQHEQVRFLFTEVKSASGDAQRDAFGRLVRLLAVHESAEELLVHPAARQSAGDEVVSARLHEEHDAKKELSELYDLGVGGAGFDKRFAAFERAVLDHAAHEEREEFPELRRTVDAKRLVDMAGAVRAAEAVAPTRPHPAAGESALGNLLAGPPLALFDRARDAVGDWTRGNRP
ncbi:hemerythrin domain-containing protein [Cryptosporangium japonicum]|uniref:Hemerythrin domain-containing protein n=1 Tax=Cryptosporangium japonicum TaxID=80872 RepID=A0ABN0UH95_9ACTN